MQNLIKVKEVEDRGKYFRVTTEKGIVFSDWTDAKPMKVGKEYVIEWWYSEKGDYRNIKYAAPKEEAMEYKNKEYEE